MLELCCCCRDGTPGVLVREMGELERSEWPGDVFRDARRYPWEPRGGVPASDLEADRPFVSREVPDCNATRVSDGCGERAGRVRPGEKIFRERTHLALGALSSSFHPVATLDDIGLEADGAWTPVQLEEEAAGIAEDGAKLVPTPKGRGGGATVLADRL